MPIMSLLRPLLLRKPAALPIITSSSRLITAATSHAFSTAKPLYDATSKKPKILLEDAENGFGFIRHNARNAKPRKGGVTEIRGPYYSVMGKRYLEDVLET